MLVDHGNQDVGERWDARPNLYSDVGLSDGGYDGACTLRYWNEYLRTVTVLRSVRTTVDA